MSEWLKRQVERSQNPLVRVIARSALAFIFVMGLVTVISAAGFSEEIQENRELLWAGTGGIALMVGFGWSYWQQYKELADSRSLIVQLQGEITDLKEERDRFAQERDSVFELMKLYKAEVREDTISALQRLAFLAIKQEQWREKEAKVERLRVEETVAADDEGMYFEVEGRIVVMINLGREDDVMEHMKFSVHDPTDLHEYGVIEIREVHLNGAQCRILEISDRAFWNDAEQAAQQGRAHVSDAPANIIVPVPALKEIPPESAQQLLTWLRSIRRIEL